MFFPILTVWFFFFKGIVRAMKTIKKNSLILEEEKKIFSELVILKGLDHPHVVKLYELFQDFENYYLITEYEFIK